MEPHQGESSFCMDNLLLSDSREHCLDWNLGIFDDLEPDIHCFEDHGLFGSLAHGWEPSKASSYIRHEMETAVTSHEASSDEAGGEDGEGGDEESAHLTLQHCPALSKVGRQGSNCKVEQVDATPRRSPQLHCETRTRSGPTRNAPRKAEGPWTASDLGLSTLRATLTGRKKATEEAREVLMDWINANRDHPYPSREQKAELAQRTGLSVPQIVHWMSNVRKRRLIPLLRGRREPRSKIDRKFLEELQRRAVK